MDFLLRPVNPTTDAAPILTRLVRRQLARFQARHYNLHPVDRDYTRSQLSAGSQGDSSAGFTLTGLQARAADYYAQIRRLRESWRSLEDVRPQLAEFELRCDTGDFDTAAQVLQAIDSGYLRRWGHYRTLVDLHGRIHRRVIDPALNAAHLCNLGTCHRLLGEYRRAINLYTQALAIFRDTGNRGGKGAVLGNLGICHYCLGEYRRAIDLSTQALAIARDIGDRQNEAYVLGIGLGECHHALGEYRRAIDLHTQALAIARDIGDRRGEGAALGNLGNCHIQLGEYRWAIDLSTQALAIFRDTGDRYGKANALGYLGWARLASGDARQAVTLLDQAVRIADATGDIEPAAEARSWLARAHLQRNDHAAALAVTAAGRELPYPTGESAMHLLAGLALLGLHRVEESVRAFRDAVAARTCCWPSRAATLPRCRLARSP